MTRLWKIAVLASLLCSGCTIGPRYQRPVAQTPVALKEMAGNDQWKMATPSDGLLKGKWWEIFGDPELNRLEELVNVNNQNVKQAEAQFRQARALVLANHANYYPTIGSNPVDLAKLHVEKKASQSFSLPATATWEPDLWGRVRLSVENAVSNAQVSAADLENIRLSQQALLATDYFLLAAQDMQLKVLSDTIGAYEKNLQLTINRHAGGVASKSDITLAQTQLAAPRPRVRRCASRGRRTSTRSPC
jgi:outer membrane protein TolC